MKDSKSIAKERDKSDIRERTTTKKRKSKREKERERHTTSSYSEMS
jgi:hypothetical protein